MSAADGGGRGGDDDDRVDASESIDERAEGPAPYKPQSKAGRRRRRTTVRVQALGHEVAVAKQQASDARQVKSILSAQVEKLQLERKAKKGLHRIAFQDLTINEQWVVTFLYTFVDLTREHFEFIAHHASVTIETVHCLALLCGAMNVTARGASTKIAAAAERAAAASDFSEQGQVEHVSRSQQYIKFRDDTKKDQFESFWAARAAALDREEEREKKERAKKRKKK